MDGYDDFICVRDMNFFTSILHERDLETRRAALTGVDLMLCECIRSATKNDSSELPGVVAIYPETMLQVPDQRRASALTFIAELIRNEHRLSAMALLPFVKADESAAIVSRAAIEYASLAPPPDNPMAGVTELIAMIEEGSISKEGAAFGGLLNLGDERVCRLLRPLRDSIDHDELLEATVINSTGVVSAANTEFWLDWLEGTELDVDFRPFVKVALGLKLVVSSSQIKDRIFVGHYAFPTRNVPFNVWTRSRDSMPISAYRKQMGSRLRDLGHGLFERDVMEEVLTAWDITL